MRKTLAFLMFLLPLASAHAAVSEIRKDFVKQTALLAPTPIMAAPAVNGSYLICVTAGDLQHSVPTTILRWVDENGQFRSFTYPIVNGVPNGCTLIRNQANTAPTLETDGTYSGFYNLFAFGLGFWTTGSQAQGGVKEPLNYTVTGANSGYKFSFPGYPWLFAVIANSNCKWRLTAGSSGTVSSMGLQISTAYGRGSGLFTTLTSACAYTLVAVQFSSPASGAGPLTDYESDLLDWTDATDPNLQTVLTAGTNGANLLLAVNIAEWPNSGTISEGLLASWGNQAPGPCSAAIVAVPTGAPASCVAPLSLGSGGTLQFLTYNTPGQEWGASPTYSAEVDVIQF
jgi:hypothetical protein